MYIENPYMTKELLDRLCAEILPFIYRPVSLYQRIGDPRIDVWDTAEFYLRFGRKFQCAGYGAEL